MRLPSRGAVYLDTSAMIYSVERNEPYFTLLAPAWQQAEAGQLIVMCSEIVIAETLVKPLREGHAELEAAFRAVLAAPEVQLIPATRELWENAARIRADTGLKTPDALHAATALSIDCTLFVTNDTDFRRVDGLPVVILDDMVEAEAEA